MDAAFCTGTGEVQRITIPAVAGLQVMFELLRDLLGSFSGSIFAKLVSAGDVYGSHAAIIHAYAVCPQSGQHVLSPFRTSRRKALNAKTALLLWTLALAGCATQTYTPKPLVPEVVAQVFLARTAADAGLADVPVWDLAALTRAAVQLHPDMQTARARLLLAQAAETSAAQKPNPTISAGGEHHTKADGVSPWSLSLGLGIPVEITGKREARMEQAAAVSEAARIEIAKTAWQVRSRLRASLLNGYVSQQKITQLQNEQQVRAEIVTLLEKRLATGLASNIEMSDARLQLRRVQTALDNVTAKQQENKALLAAAMGLPETAVDTSRISYAVFEKETVNLPATEVQRAALLNRLDVRQALANYAATEAKLKLEIARQIPDFNLGPSYGWDQGDNRWGLGVSLVLALLNKNEGAIAEANAQREIEARKFEALQASVIGEQEQALARVTVAKSELEQGKILLKAEQARLAQTQRLFDSGQADRLELNLARLQVVAADGVVNEANIRVQQFLGQLEDAVQQPLDGSVREIE